MRCVSGPLLTGRYQTGPENQSGCLLANYLTAQCPNALFVSTPSAEITNVFVRNIISYFNSSCFNSAQAALDPQ